MSMAKKKSNNTNTKSTPNNTTPIKEHKNKSENQTNHAQKLLKIS